MPYPKFVKIIALASLIPRSRQNSVTIMRAILLGPTNHRLQYYYISANISPLVIGFGKFSLTACFGGWGPQLGFLDFFACLLVVKHKQERLLWLRIFCKALLLICILFSSQGLRVLFPERFQTSGCSSLEGAAASASAAEHCSLSDWQPRPDRHPWHAVRAAKPAQPPLPLLAKLTQRSTIVRTRTWVSRRRGRGESVQARRGRE